MTNLNVKILWDTGYLHVLDIKLKNKSQWYNESNNDLFNNSAC